MIPFLYVIDRWIIQPGLTVPSQVPTASEPHTEDGEGHHEGSEGDGRDPQWADCETWPRPPVADCEAFKLHRWKIVSFCLFQIN